MAKKVKSKVIEVKRPKNNVKKVISKKVKPTVKNTSLSASTSQVKHHILRLWPG